MATQRNIPAERDRAVPPADFSDSELPPDPDAPDMDDAEVSENEDGSATVNFADSEEPEGDPDFLENLADVLQETELQALATDLLAAFERDKDSRKKRDEQYAEGIRRTGLSDEAPGGAAFEGATKIVHPVLVEGCIEFSARSMKELFPPTGPVKTQVIGEQSEAKLAKAERKKTYMNWQLTKQIKEYRAELEQTLTQVPLGGSQYLKVWYDDRVERPRVEFVPVDEMLLPYSASDFYSAERRTHVQRITQQVFEARVASGLYRDVAVGESSGFNNNETAAGKAAERVEGKEDPAYNEDGLRTVFESYIERTIEGDPLADGQRGYIITIDESSSKVLGLYRNWDEEDEKKCPETLEWIVEFGFIPWRGAYKIGLSHIIGGLSGALTGALRGILDSAHLNNTAGGIMLKGARAAGQAVSGDPTEFTPLEGPPNVDDIRKLAMPYPFNPPSTVLFQLLDWLTNQAKGVVSTASEAIKDAGSDMPVGTALALIEQGSITFSAVHARLHESQKRVLEILHRINGIYLDDEVTVEELGSLVVGRKDFQGPMDIIPVSDPNIFSDAQRYAQNQAAMAMAEKFPGAFKLPQLIGRAMQLMNYPAWEEVVAFPKEAKKLDAVPENAAASEEDTTLKAYPDQDHLKHLHAHVAFMVSPIMCANPMMGMPALPKLLAHAKEHLIALYKQHTEAALASMYALKKMKGGSEPDDRDVMLAIGLADKELSQMIAPMMPQLQAAQALAQKLAPKPNDPRMAAAATQMQIAQAKIADAQQARAQDGQIKQAELAQDAQANAQDNAQKAAENQQEMQVASQNAALAADSEQKERDLKLIIQHMQEDTQRMLAAFSEQTSLEIARITKGFDGMMATRQQEFDALQAESQRRFDAMQAAMQGHNANATAAADAQAAHVQNLVTAAKDVSMQAADHDHQAEQAELDRQHQAQQQAAAAKAAEITAVKVAKAKPKPTAT